MRDAFGRDRDIGVSNGNGNDVFFVVSGFPAKIKCYYQMAAIDAISRRDNSDVFCGMAKH